MSYLLFFFWLIFLSWSLTKIGFIKKAGLSSKIIIALFLCKVIAGLISGRITQGAISSDTWGYHIEALKEYQLLFSDPGEYFGNLFHSGYADGYNGVFTASQSFWNDLKTNLIIKFVSVLHIFSGRNYYVNVVLFNFLLFFGSIGFFRVFDQVYPGRSKLVAGCTFLLPSVLFYGSTIHKDGIIFAAVGVVLFNVYHALHGAGFTIKGVIFVLLSLLLIFLIRSYVLLALLPALTALIIATKKKYNPWVTFSIIYLVAGILFFTVGYFLPSFDLPEYIVQKQADFLSIGKANTTIPVRELHPFFTSFAANAPQALAHSLARPYLTDASLSFLLLPLSIELLCYQLLLVLFIFFRREETFINDPVTLFGILFALPVCLMIGYTVPIIGAIVRYRSIYLPFFIIPIVCNMDWEKLKNLLHFKK